LRRFMDRFETGSALVHQESPCYQDYSQPSQGWLWCDKVVLRPRPGWPRCLPKTRRLQRELLSRLPEGSFDHGPVLWYTVPTTGGGRKRPDSILVQRGKCGRRFLSFHTGAGSSNPMPKRLMTVSGRRIYSTAMYKWPCFRSSCGPLFVYRLQPGVVWTLQELLWSKSNG